MSCSCGLSLVQPDQHLVGVVLVVADDPRPDALERRQVAGLVGLEVDGVQVAVLVAAGVLEVEQVLVVVAQKVLADAAVVSWVTGRSSSLPTGRTQTWRTFFSSGAR